MFYLDNSYSNYCRKGDDMMPLSMAGIGESNTIKKVGGKEETRLFLERLGFTPGANVRVVSETAET